MQVLGSLLGAVHQLLLLAAIKFAEPVVGEVVGNTSSSRAPTSSSSLFYVAAFFPNSAVDRVTREMLGIYPRVAAEMAVGHINERGVLPHRLEMITIETGCNLGESTYGLSQVLRERPLSAILGPACETPAIILGGITSRNIGVVEVSYAAQSPLLSRVDEHPYFFRTVPPLSSYGETIYAIMRYFDWLDVSVVHEATSTYTLALEEIFVLLRERDSRTKIEDSFFITALSDVPKGVGWIFVGLFPESRAAEIMCIAYRRGLNGENHLWILLGEYYEGWWLVQTSHCSSEELQSALESTLIITHLQHLDHNHTTVSGLTPWEFWRSYSSMVRDAGLEFHPEMTSRVPAAYDAMWSFALAVNQSMDRIQQDGDIMATCNSFRFGYGNFNRMVREAMENLSFAGVSGEVSFSPNQHSTSSPTTTITQIQSGKLVPIGVYDSKQDFLNLSTFGNNLTWQGGRPPLDRPNTEPQLVDTWLVAVVFFLVGVCIVFAIAMLTVDWLYRKHKVIKASSPYINLLIIAGVLIGCISVVLISLDSGFMAPHNVNHNIYTVLCNVRPWTYSLSFTLAFGAIFFKTCRLYAIFRNPWSQKRYFTDCNLVLMVLGLLAIDALILTLWMIVDPLVVTDVLVNQQSQSFVRVIELHEVCSSEQMYMWIILVVLPKGILLLLGMFLVKQTGKIKVKVFRGAKYTGIAIYGVVFSCGVGVPLAIFTMFSNEEDVTYVASTGTILSCSYLILTMVFVPKLVLLRRYKSQIPTAVLLDINPNFTSRQQARTIVPAKISSSKQLAKFNASSIEALHDETNELEDAWEPTVELPKISGQQS